MRKLKLFSKYMHMSEQDLLGSNQDRLAIIRNLNDFIIHIIRICSWWSARWPINCMKISQINTTGDYSEETPANLAPTVDPNIN